MEEKKGQGLRVKEEGTEKSVDAEAAATYHPLIHACMKPHPAWLARRPSPSEMERERGGLRWSA